MAEEQQEISIEDLELSLEVYEIESEQKLANLQQLFNQKGHLEIAKVFYEERSSLEIKFQNIISDLIEFLVRQQVATTQKLRKLFYRILESPLLMIFKVSRFEIFNLRLQGFDIELEPIEAIIQLANSINLNLDTYLNLCEQVGDIPPDIVGFISYQHFLRQAALNSIREKIFVFYSYLRKGGNILKKKFENKVQIVDAFNNIQKKILKELVKNKDWKTLKQLSILNYEIYQIENTFDVCCFYLYIPLAKGAEEVFKEVQTLAEKAKLNSNYDLFIFSFLRNYQQIFAKLKQQGINSYFYRYIDNVLICLLEMWGCRLCHYKQFCRLFELLLTLYTPTEEILEKCLKHKPNLQKDDIVLMRTNFKIELQKKHPQLLILLHEQTIEQTNNFLNQLFHRKAYNLQFKHLTNQKIVNLLTFLNGNPSLQQFFKVVQKSIKEWNYTIDFSNSYKFIANQFKYPQIGQEKVLQSIQLIRNLCVLWKKGFNQDYKALLKSSSILKFIIQLISFMSKNPNSQVLFDKKIIQQFLGDSLQFLLTQSQAVQKQNIYLLFSNISKRITNKALKQALQQAILQNCANNIQLLTIDNLIQVIKNLGNIKSKKIIRSIMKNAHQNNQKIKKFKYIDQQIKLLNQANITQSDASFIIQHCIIKGKKLVHKNNQIFKISELQLVTNPIQFEKVMDNYYFSLENNSKKFIQYLLQQWVTNYDQLYSQSILELVIQYPICIPVIATTKVKVSQNQSVRFIELLCDQVGKKDKVHQILNSIIKCQLIRYRNGVCYIKQQINPIILKTMIKNINNPQCTSAASILQVLTLALKNYNINNIKIDLISKIIEKTKWLIENQNKSQIADRLSFCLYQIISIFFSKKQAQMRKNNFANQIHKYIWNDVRQYTRNQSENIIQNKIQASPIINDQYICSPFSLSHDYTNQDLKLIKQNSQLNSELEKIISFKDIESKIEKILQQSQNLVKKNNLEDWKQIQLTKLSCNLRFHLGRKQINQLEQRLKVKIVQKEQDKIFDLGTQNNEQSINLVKYYIKQLEFPIVNQTLILDSFVKVVSTNDRISYLWANPRNLQRIFVTLIRLYSYIASKKKFPQTQQNNPYHKLLNIIQQNRINAMKRIMNFFCQIGYTDLWGQCHANFNNQDTLKIMLPLQQNSTQSFLSSLLKATLQTQQLKGQLNLFLENLFKTRQPGQNALIYKVQIDRHLLNLIMKSLEIDNLNQLSFFIHSNFNNLRLYTDQLHEGLKALNIVSKNRSYNQFIQISKQYQDQQFYIPIKLFKQNYKFFIRIQKDGYNFKKNEQAKLTLERISKVIKEQSEKLKLEEEVARIMAQYKQEIKKIQLNLANRIKSFYLVTKLRDLTYQNSITISTLFSILKEQLHKNSQQILQQIQKIEIFSLLNTMLNDLIFIEYDWDDDQHFKVYHTQDRESLQKNLNICTTRRFSHSMSKLYEQVDLQMDQLAQRCLDSMKIFLVSSQGQIWIKNHNIYPPLILRSFIPDGGKSEALIKKIKNCLQQNEIINQKPIEQIIVVNQDIIKDTLKGLKTIPNNAFYKKLVKINYQGKLIEIQNFLPQLLKKIIDSQTLVILPDSKYLLFNKYKTSQTTLECIEALGYIIGYCIYHKIKTNINFHPSILAALSFNIANLDDLYEVDFKAWQQLKNILNVAQSKELQLNFSRNFQDLQTLQIKRIQLVKQGSSKKVNNLNRQQYVDLVYCYLLYRNYQKHINRLLQSICFRVPKQLISCIPYQSILNLFYPQNQSNEIVKKTMNKVGLILPQMIWINGIRVHNLKDYQNINWLVQSLFQSQQLQTKFWPFSTNLFVVTTIGAKPSLHINHSKIIIHHFENKQSLKKALIDYK